MQLVIHRRGLGQEGGIVAGELYAVARQLVKQVLDLNASGHELAMVMAMACRTSLAYNLGLTIPPSRHSTARHDCRPTPSNRSAAAQLPSRM